MRPSDRARRKASAPELIIPVAGSLYAIYYVASVWDFPPEAQLSGIVLAAILLTLSALYFLRVARVMLAGGFDWQLSWILGPVQGRGERLAFLGLIVFYLLFVSYGGFTLTTFIFVGAGSYLAGLRPARRAFTFAALSAIGGWLFFIVLLGTRFPQGPFEMLVSWVQTWI